MLDGNGRAWSLAPAAMVLSLLAAGCPSNTCLLSVNGRCTWSTCPDGADFDTQRKTCVCQPNRIPLGGGCLTLAAANQYCGKGAHFENAGCAPNRCAPGLEIDQDTGACTTPQQATQVASNMGVQVGQNQKLGCPQGEQLVVEGQQASCVPLQQTCGRDEVWDGRVCRKTGQCPPGSGYDAQSGGCVKFATTADSRSYTVDLPTWVRTSYGADGGPGSSSFCGAFNKHPLAFGVRAGTTMRLKIMVRIDVPGGDVTHATVSTLAAVESSGAPAAAKGSAEVQQAAQNTLGSLVAGGGQSSVATALTTVGCSVVNSSAPTAVTVSGGV